MNRTATEFSDQAKGRLEWSPLLLIGVSVILGMAILFFAVRDSEREKLRMETALLDRGNALIWALEAGTRTWLGYEGDRNILQLLIDETAKQPGVLYLAVVDAGGRVLAHSEREAIGTALTDLPPGGAGGADSTGWRVREVGGAPVFEAYRLFAPLREDVETMGHGRHHGAGREMEPMGRGRMAGRRRMMEFGFSPGARSLVLVGFDMQPFQEALAADRRNTLLSAAVVAALALGGFVSLFWAHSHRRSRRMLMDARALSSEIVSSLPLGLIATGTDGRVETVNAVARAMLGDGGNGFVGEPMESLPGLDWASVAGELATGGAMLERETELTAPGGRTVPVRLSASRIRNGEGGLLGHIFILGDLGEVRRLQSEIRRNERLTALGNLAAGVAHEIRNPLSTIKGLATYMSGRMPSGGRGEEAAKTMIQEVNRLNNVVSELLEFARPGAAGGETADVNAVIARALRLAEADIASTGVAVDFRPDPDAPPVRANPERLAQALLNLILNAVQAMSGGGTLRIFTARPIEGLLAITVADTGPGIPDALRNEIFNPYFTTKPSGTGLGLAIVHQIAEASGGSVTVKSAPGAGSAFTLSLPLEKEGIHNS